MSELYYFDFKEKKYKRNTIARLNRDFVISNFEQDCVIARALVGNDKHYCFALVGTIDPITNRECLVRIMRDEIETAIEEIIEPHEVQIQNVTKSTEKYHDWDYTGLITGWVIYIFFMCLWCIFNGCIGLWILTSVVFFTWRNNKLKPYKKNK